MMITRKLLNQISNIVDHLDIECIEALGESLSNWGGKDGSVVVVSHDRAFCESVGFTHVGTVKDGTVVIEERGLMDSDWARYDINGAALGGCDDIVPVMELTKEEKEEQERKRKLAFNAPKVLLPPTMLLQMKHLASSPYSHVPPEPKQFWVDDRPVV